MNTREMFDILIDYPLDDALHDCMGLKAEQAVHEIDDIFGDDYLGWRRWIGLSIHLAVTQQVKK